MLRVVGVAFVMLVVVAAVVGAGFLVPVRPLPATRPAVDPERVPIPSELPAPVERYLRAVSPDGRTLPLVEAFEARGTAWARPFGLWLPVRHRAFIVPGQTMFRVMDFPWYGFRMLHVEDTFLNGVGMTAISGLIRGRTTGPHTDQGAFLALAAESITVPSASALGGTWEPVDEARARLVFTYRGEREALLVTFDPGTGLPLHIDAQRYQDEAGEKIGWRIDLLEYGERSGLLVPVSFEITWENATGPWSRWQIDDVVFTVPQPAPAGSTRAS